MYFVYEPGCVLAKVIWSGGEEGRFTVLEVVVNDLLVNLFPGSKLGGCVGCVNPNVYMEG